MRKDLISIADFSREDICRFFSLAAVLKKQRRDGVRHPLLEGKVMAMIFEKPSLRTRVTFETGMFDLGGTAIYLSPSDIGLGKRESVKDTAENLERWVHLIMARTFSHRAVEELADSCSIPVINALTDLLHPCQVLADLLTVIEHFDLDPADPDFGGIDFAFISDGNNVANSWINAAGVLGFSFTISCPEGYDPDPGIWAEAEKRGAALASVRDPRAAAEASCCTNARSGALAATMALERASIGPEDIGLVISGSSASDHLTPAEAATVAGELGIEAPCMDLNSACSTFGMQALWTSWMRPEKLPPFVLLVQPENLTRCVDYSDRRVAPLFGDGSSAAVVSATVPSTLRLADAFCDSAPSQWDKVRIPGSPISTRTETPYRGSPSAGAPIP